MRKYFLFLLIILFSSFNLTAQTKNVNAKKLISSIALDGLLEESFWEISNQINITSNGNSDNTAEFGILWDENYLYIGVQVTDNNLSSNLRQGWYDDGIEICIDGNYSRDNAVSAQDRLFVKAINSYWIQEKNLNLNGVIHKYIETANGYSIEFAIPWSNLNESPSQGKKIGFEIVVNDDDDSDNIFNTPTQLIWNSSGNYYKNPSLWGSITLIDQTAQHQGDYLALVAPNGGDYLINNNIFTIEWISEGISNVDIEYSLNNGNSWNSIVQGLSAGAGSYDWYVSAGSSTQCKLRVSSSGNPGLNDISKNVFTISEVLTPVEPMVTNIWKNYVYPYNAYYPVTQGGINGHVGNSCGPSSLARIMHHWEFPRRGSNQLTFTDNGGFTWSANFGETIYNYDNMPDYLSPNSSEEEYKDVATLFYHAATSMRDIGGSGTDLNNMSFALSNYFNFKPGVVAYRKDFTRAEWIALMMNELDNGRVLLIQGMTPENVDGCGNWHENNCIAGHWYNVDGYNDKGEFHVIVGFGDMDGYFDVDQLSDFAYNIGILTDLEPDLGNKQIALQNLNGDEIVIAGQDVEIQWSSENITNLIIEYTTDNGATWLSNSSEVNASLGSYTWTTPNIESDQCKIRITDSENINVYDKSDKVFSLRQFSLNLISPNGGESFIPGDMTEIKWENTPVNQINIEHSTDNGSTWNIIEYNYPSISNTYNWQIPNTFSKQSRVKISAVSNPGIFDISDNEFEILLPNNNCGPYLVDENTILLLHFENDFKNQSDLCDDAIPNGNGISFHNNSVDKLGRCVKFDHSQGNPFLSVAQNQNLNLLQDWTIELWFNTTEFKEALQYFIQKPGDNDNYFANYALQLNTYWNDDIFCFYFYGQNRVGISKPKPQLNTWYHLAFIRDTQNSELNLIIHDSNRNEIYSQNISDSGTDPLTSVQNLLIANQFIGYIDEVRISNIVRTFETTNYFAPIVSGFNDQTIMQSESFEAINLDDYVIDPNHTDSDITWSFSGNNELLVEINDNRIATITAPSETWIGSETLLFTATDPTGLSDDEEVVFTITEWNDPPVIAGLTDRTINEGGSFEQLVLADYVSDTNHDDSEMFWRITGNEELTFQVTNGIVSINIPDENWFGSETITFTVTDPLNASDEQSVTFTVIGVNDPPVITAAPELIEYDSDSSVTINIREFISDVESDAADLICTFSVDVDSILCSFDESTGILTLSAELLFGGEGILTWHISDGEDITETTTNIKVNKAVLVGIDDHIIPEEFSLEQNYPNPFNPSTTIRYALPIGSEVRIDVFDNLGKHVELLLNQVQSAGIKSIVWNAGIHPSGVYYIRADIKDMQTSKHYNFVRKMLLLK
jgi:hypothetical protein